MVQVKALYDHTKAVYVQMIEPNVKPYTRVYTFSETTRECARKQVCGVHASEYMEEKEDKRVFPGTEGRNEVPGKDGERRGHRRGGWG